MGWAAGAQLDRYILSSAVATVETLLDADANPIGAWVATKPPNGVVAVLLISRGVDPPDA